MADRQRRESGYATEAEKAYNLVSGHAGPGYSNRLTCRGNALLFAFLE